MRLAWDCVLCDYQWPVVRADIAGASGRTEGTQTQETKGNGSDQRCHESPVRSL